MASDRHRKAIRVLAVVGLVVAWLLVCALRQVADLDEKVLQYQQEYTKMLTLLTETVTSLEARATLVENGFKTHVETGLTITDLYAYNKNNAPRRWMKSKRKAAIGGP